MSVVTKSNATGSTVYQVEDNEGLVCPKCQLRVDYLLGEEQFMACERCYDGTNAPAVKPEFGETVGIVGESNQVAELKGKPNLPTAPTEAAKLDEILGRKDK